MESNLVYAPFGLRPAYKEGGNIVSTNITLPILSTYAANIFNFAPVKVGANGTLQLAASGDAFVGTFLGVQYTDTVAKRRVVSNWWPSGTTGTEIVAYYTRDPYITYQIQADAAVDQDKVGGQSDTTTATDGNTTTGLSAVGLSAAGIVQTGEFKQLRIVGFAPGPENGPSDLFPGQTTYPILEVQISDHQYVAGRNAF